MREAVIVAAVRTPVGKRDGGLAGVHPADLSAVVLNALAERTGIDPGVVDDVVWGCVSQVGDQSSNIGRYSVLAAGWPESIPGTTVNRACGSSQQALDFAAQAVMSGQQDVVVAGGVEVMSRVPLGSARASGMPYGPGVLARYDGFSFNQGVSAERIAQKWGFTRTRLDEFAALSHERAAAALDSGVFEEQIVPVSVGDRTVWCRRGRAARDHCRQPRPAQARLPGRRCDPRGQRLPDLRRRRRPAGDDTREGARAGPRAARALPRRCGRRRRPGAHADRADPRDRAGARKAGRRPVRGRRLRGERGLRARTAGLARRDGGRSGAAQSVGRGHRPRASARGVRRGADDPHDPPHAGAAASATACRPCARAAGQRTPPSSNSPPDQRQTGAVVRRDIFTPDHEAFRGSSGTSWRTRSSRTTPAGRRPGGCPANSSNSSVRWACWACPSPRSTAGRASTTTATTWSSRRRRPAHWSPWARYAPNSTSSSPTSSPTPTRSSAPAGSPASPPASCSRPSP